ncbi:MAG: hypothetical protein K2P51_03965 [Rhabdochlamydiaceae bacterium]|nr:hypothetical protein [Rhabdochlamydiaceae bacterium]
MTWNELEHLFNRALQFTFSRKKLLFTAPVLILCGLVVVFCKSLARGSGNWIALSLTFLPIFICSALLITAGIVLTRVYHHEVKNLSFSFRRTFRESWDLMVQVAYLTLPLILGYFVLWTLLGVFYLLKEIPGIGDFLGVVLSFGPFLLLLGSFVLSLLSVTLLFFLTPAVALRSSAQFQVFETLLKRFRSSPFSNGVFFILGILPVIVVVAMMMLAALVTGKSYFMAEHSFASAVQLFFIMLPFSILLSPAVIFFFNFSAESHVWMQRKLKQENT